MSNIHEIEGKPVTEESIGSPVTYCPPHTKMNCGHKDAEQGHISSFNDLHVFVRFRGPNGAACRTDLLVWG